MGLTAIRIVRSTRMEDLVDALARVVEEPLSSPFMPETIVVPARTMGDWLGLRLSEKHGIWANPRFVTIDRFIAELDGRKRHDEDPFATLSLAWAVAGALPRLLKTKPFAAVDAYLADDTDTTQRVALSARIASAFSRYLAHRPELLLSWERSQEDTSDEHAAWEAPLWRGVVQRLGKEHRAKRDGELGARLDGLPLPERLSVFAPESLPKSALDVLDALSQRLPVHVFARTSGEHALEPSLGARERELRAAIAACGGVNEKTLPSKASTPDVLVHSCHSPMRECEVLRDQLLAALDADKSLEARDVLVLCPDLDGYAPVIEAVFGIPEKAEGFLPYRIVDRSARRTLKVVEAFLALLDLAPSRLTATDVMDLIAREPVRAKFDLEEGDIDVVRRWIEDCRIRWAEDEHHRKEVGQPAFRENTWRFGLDRLILGYAMGSDTETPPVMCGSCLPYDDVEGTTTETLGGFAAFCEELFAVRKDLGERTRVPLAAWRDRLTDVLARMCAGGWQTDFQHAMIREALDAIVARAERAGFTDEVPLSVAREALAGELDERVRSLEHAVGGITFASFVSSRCVPARVVAMLGMNDGDFPRAPYADAFDLAGPKTARDDDRQAFLDALLSARDRVVITYIGQSIANNKERPPSVVVSELLDTFPNRDAVLLKHPLHAFSPAYFGDADDRRLFSHAAALCDGARSMRGKRSPLPRLVERPLPPPKDMTRTVTLEALVRFFEHPVRAFMQGRLGITLGRDMSPLEDREPIDLDALEKWIVADPLIGRGRKGEDLASGVPADLVGAGQLPIGVVGEFAYRGLLPELMPIVERVKELVGSERPDPVAVDIDVGGTRIVGHLQDVCRDAHVLHTYSASCGRKDVRAWVRHVVLQCMGIDRDTVMVCKKGETTRFTKIDDARAVLASLVDLYWRGLEGPLLLFPDSARVYLDHAPQGHDVAFAKARGKFLDEYGVWTCAYVQRAFGETDDAQPLDDDFEPFGTSRTKEERARFPSFVELTQAVFGPMGAATVEDG